MNLAGLKSDVTIIPRPWTKHMCVQRCSKVRDASRCYDHPWSKLNWEAVGRQCSQVLPLLSRQEIPTGNCKLPASWMEHVSQGRSPRVTYIQWCAYWVLILSMSNSLELPSSALSEWQLKSDLSKPMGIIKSKVLSAHRLQPAKWSQRDSWFPYTVPKFNDSWALHRIFLAQNDSKWRMVIDVSTAVRHDCNQAAPLPKLMSEDGKPQK